MTKRLIAVVDSAESDGPYKARARVYRDTEWDEWRVRYYHGDQLLSYMGEESDSFHGDQADAIGTAEQQVKSLAKQSMPGSRLENPANMDLVVTRYRSGEFGLDWARDNRPAVERTYKTEAEARAAAAKLFPDYKVLRLRVWGEK